jgi:ATP-dependent helicase HrpB
VTEGDVSTPIDLPVAAVLEEVVRASRTQAVVVTAPPGSGKTTLIPPAILDDLDRRQEVVLVQPRRLAARAVAAEIARRRGCRLGEEIGYRVRFDVKATQATRLSVETTGVMLRRMLSDVALDGVGCVVLDEFHERSIEMDLIFGMLCRLRRELRPDLRLVVTSATLPTAPVAAALGGEKSCRVIEAEGRCFPVDIRYLRRGERMIRDDVAELLGRMLPRVLRETSGHVLIFLPGVGEIERSRRLIEPQFDEHVLVLPLYGDLAAAQQDKVFAEDGRRKVILSTNVAETSVTVPGVTAVIDSGDARQLRVASATGLPRLELVSISQAAAEQRAGRAGRTAPGVCLRLWDEVAHQRRDPVEIPEVLRSDLAAAVLQLVALGGWADFPWLDAPPNDALERAVRLLQQLKAVTLAEDGSLAITTIGHQLASLPCHPRLGAFLLAGASSGVLLEASLAAALLSERDPFRTQPGGPRDIHRVRSRCDLSDRVTALKAFAAGHDSPEQPLHPPAARGVLRVAEQMFRMVATPGANSTPATDEAFRRALLTAFPDRLVKLRAGSRDRGTMVGGRGVRIDRSSRVTGEPFFLAVDLDDGSSEAKVRMASAVERAWLDEMPHLLETGESLLWNPSQGRAEARRQRVWCDLVIDETPIAVADPVAASHLLAEAASVQLAQYLPSTESAAGSLLARVRWLAATLPDLGLPPFDETALRSLLSAACGGLTSLDDLRRRDWLPYVQAAVGFDRLADIDRLAPESLEVPSGNRHRLQYEIGRPPVLAVRIQEVFGMPATPRIAGGRIAVLLHLLGPNHRPQQVTDDLASFWANTYAEVKKELRRRYPKHAWPDDPLTAVATPSGLSENRRRSQT